MFATVTHLDISTLNELITYLPSNDELQDWQDPQHAQDISGLIATAVRFWLDENKHRAAAMPLAADSATAADPARGYQWKLLFLPEGTYLRTLSYGEHQTAVVVGDQILHHGRVVTPNQFARSFTSTRRNAWVDIVVRLPGEKNWTIASKLRRNLQQAEQRKLAMLARSDSGPLTAFASAAIATSALPAGGASGGNGGHAPEPAPVAGKNWTLPERRKMRYRLEDVAFE